MKELQLDKIKEIKLTQGSEEWHRLRKGKITGSNISKTLTSSKGDILDSGYTYIYQLIGDMSAVLSDDLAQMNDYKPKPMQFGNDFEAIARQVYEKFYGKVVRETGCFANDLFLYSPDGVITDLDFKDKGLIEIKCPYTNISYVKQVVVEPNKDYLKQMAFGLLLTNLEYIDFVLFNPRMDGIHDIESVTDISIFTKKSLYVRTYTRADLKEYIDRIKSDMPLFLERLKEVMIAFDEKRGL